MLKKVYILDMYCNNFLINEVIKMWLWLKDNICILGNVCIIKILIDNLEWNYYF